MPCLLILENAPSAEARHASLREGLRRMLGVPVEVVYDTLGKPSLVGDTPLRYLSVTTTGSYMGAALAETPLGIDGERRDRFTPDRTARLLAAANRFFTAADASFVRADPRRVVDVPGDNDGVDLFSINYIIQLFKEEFLIFHDLAGPVGYPEVPVGSVKYPHESSLSVANSRGSISRCRTWLPFRQTRMTVPPFSRLSQ